jgi:dihydrofolate reductase
MRELTYFVATSLDGWIADLDGGFDAFPMEGDHIAAYVNEYPETMPAPALSAMGITPTNDTFDTVLMGWNTFAVGLPHGLDDPYPHLRQFVLSRRHGADEVGPGIELTSRDPVDLVRELKRDGSERGIWLCGGGVLADAVRDEIDRLVLKINPIVLGTGRPLFAGETSDANRFDLESVRSFESGVMMAAYRRAE